MFNLECKKKKKVISPSWNLNGDYMNNEWTKLFIKHTTSYTWRGTINFFPILYTMGLGGASKW
jgi:hypothetical protein